MPKLNLDIFGPDASLSGARQGDETHKAGEADTSGAAESAACPFPETPVSDTGNASPRFVPVGFHEEHLRLLDEAVFALRHQGFRQASKSAIIRRLIEIHRDELPRIYLDGAARC